MVRFDVYALVNPYQGGRYTNTSFNGYQVLGNDGFPYEAARTTGGNIAQFIQRLGFSQLGRMFSQGELVNGLNYVANRTRQLGGTTNAQQRAESELAGVIISSPEAQQLRALPTGTLVDRLYQNLLGRAADAGGRAFWINTLNAGATFQDVELAFANTAEFAARNPGFLR